MPPASRPTKLTKLVIDEISDVEFGANQHAHTSIIKSETGGSSVNITEILKALAGLSEADRAEVAKAVAVAKADPLADLPAEHQIRKQIAEAEAKAVLLAKRLDEMAEERAIAKAVTTGVYFRIEHTPDSMGALIGAPLHLSVHDETWWAKKLNEHFRLVRVHGDGVFTCFGGKNGNV